MNQGAIVSVSLARCDYTVRRRSTDIGTTQRSLIRLATGAGILGLVVVWMGPAPFRRALGSVSAGPLALAVAVTAVATLCAAWRWRIVAGRLGISLPLPAAVAAYYRSQFLNSTLPGGVLGDVHRGIRHGRDADALGLALRAVGWERSLGQVVQVTLAALVLLVLPFTASAELLLVVAGTAAGAVGVAVLLWKGRPHSHGVVLRAVSALTDDLRRLVRAPRAAVGIVIASTGVVVGHVTIFVIAARAAGVSASLGRLLPVALTVLVVSALPTNIAGWGPREGAAAWAFAAAGLGGTAGVTTAVVFGVLTLAATLPGAVVLVTGGPRSLGPPATKQSPTRELAQVSHG